MEKIVARHRNVIRVVAGHIHRPIHVAWGGTIASTAPSPCHQVPLDLAAGDGYELVMEPRAIQLHVFDPGYGLVSHLSYVPSGYRYITMLDTLSKSDRSELVERTRRDYEELRRTEYDPPSAK